MKNKWIFPILLLIVSLAAGCTAAKTDDAITYSNLSDDSICHDVDVLLRRAGVSDERRNVLFNHVAQFNEVMDPSGLTDGFEPLGPMKYDPYQLQDAWNLEYPDFLGYNCRITAFSLAEETILTVPKPENPPSTELMEFDLMALQEDSSALSGSEENFLSFFSPVPTEDTKDIEIHVEKVRSAWEDRGITFQDDHRISMINVFFHMQDGDRNLLYVGHSGILLHTPDGELWFLEKLSFQEPYQLVSFKNRRQLAAYLMGKYDLDQGQPMARPFIMEDNALMKG